MNIVLFEATEIDRGLPLDDPRARHVVQVIGCGVDDRFDVGLIDGPRGKARITAVGPQVIELDFAFEKQVPQLHPVALIVGMPRPPSARRILKDVTSLGADQIYFVGTDRGERSYLSSRLWTKGEYRRLLLEGAEQAFCTRLPQVVVHQSLAACLDQVDLSVDLLAMDNYEASQALGHYRPVAGRTLLAVGSERGWSAAERDLLRQRGFVLVHTGQRVLKTETACIAGLSLVLGRRS
ncbi:MAG: RsmE family RNA methyltransferase [Candidatus Latescibacteria bacterium]|nr:RsmE family RNA methyltransferase [Candidatus Latescibacterota bacterium]